MKAIIAGGGIGGLTAALSLHEAGIDCEVYEAVPALRPLGVGINLLPHAVRELTELGLADKLAEIAIPTRELIYTNKFGQRIWQEDRGRHAGYHWPQYSIHRGALQMLLLAEVTGRLGATSVHPGWALADAEQDEAGVTAWFTDPDGRDRRSVRGDLLIGADGIHSALRAKYYPDEGPPIWNGCVLWRATSEAAPYLGGHSMVMAGHANQKFVCYPISAEADRQGRSLINWIAELRFDPSIGWAREDWNRPGKIEDFLPSFESWNFGWLDVPGLIRSTNAVYEYPMVDRDPVDHWTFGRTTLLGDAAHAMFPIGSNGASQAIIDARVLAWLLATEPDVTSALKAYEAERLPRTSEIVRANRANGPERVMQLVEERAPEGYEDLESVISADELDATAKQYKLIAGFDKDVLNEAPSKTPPRPGA